MKKAIIIAAICITTIVALLGGTVLTLSLIKVRPMEEFGGYEKAVIYRGFNTPGESTTAHEAAIENALKTVEFSIWRAFTEKSTDYKIALKTVIINEGKDDEEEEAVKYAQIDDFASVIKANAGEFMLVLDYGFNEIQKDVFKDEDGNKINFNKLLIIIPNPASEIQTVRLFPYSTAELNNEYYYIYEFSAKMFTNDLYNELIDYGFKPTQSNI